MLTMKRIFVSLSDFDLWIFVNMVLFLYVGIFQLIHGYGPGGIFSAGAVLLAIIYFLLWTLRRTDRKLADQTVMLISGLAIIGDLAVAGWLTEGSLSGESALLDVASLLLFSSAYHERSEFNRQR